MVIGASVAPKLVIVCGALSSITRKFSFFSPVRMSPCCVAAITSSVTTGTSTEIDAPASGGFCCTGGGVGATGGAPCCAPPCGPAGDCALASRVPSGSKSAAAKIPKNNVVSIAFIGYSSWHIIERSNLGGNVPNPGDPHRGAYETTCHCRGRVPTPCMLV